MRKESKQLVAILVIFSIVMSVAFSNPMVADAATKVLTNYAENTLSAEDVASDLYLTNVYTLNNNKSFVGVFSSNSAYTYYFAKSDDLVNWNLASEYFSLVNGNDIFVGISTDKNYKYHLNYTKDGNTWKVAQLPEGVSPRSVKFEHGYFKLFAKDAQENKLLYLSKDASTWFDITNDVPAGTDIENIIINDEVIYTLTGANSGGTGFKMYSAKVVDENPTNWTSIEKLKKDGYNMMGNFMYDGETVGVQLYSIADYEKNQYVSDSLYYVTNDFVNWTEKDWSTTEDFYSTYDSTSTAKVNIAIDGKRFEAIENYPYTDGGQRYYCSYIVHSVDGINWKKDAVNIFANGKKVSKDPQKKNDFNIPSSIEWSRKGVEYTLSRNYLSMWDVDGALSQNITRGKYLILIMKALNVKPTDTTVSGYVPFSDVDNYGDNLLINEAKKLGLVNGKANNEFDPYGEITRQDMMVMTYNILLKSGVVTADTTLSSLNGYTDKDKVKNYAKEAVSSLIKANIIKGSNNTINPLGKLSNAEGMTIAERLNIYRTR